MLKKIGFILSTVFFSSNLCCSSEIEKYDISGIKLNDNIENSLNIIKKDNKYINIETTKSSFTKGMFKSKDIILSYDCNQDYAFSSKEDFINRSYLLTIDLEKNKNITSIEQRIFFKNGHENFKLAEDIMVAFNKKYGKPDYINYNKSGNTIIGTYCLWTKNKLNPEFEKKIMANTKGYYFNILYHVPYGARSGKFYNEQSDKNTIDIINIDKYLMCKIEHDVNNGYNHLGKNYQCILVDLKSIFNSKEWLLNHINTEEGKFNNEDTQKRKTTEIKL